jgi:hypothetical protein
MFILKELIIKKFYPLINFIDFGFKLHFVNLQIAFDFDFLRKRMIIGDTKGNIALYNTANGAKMKNLTRHAA